MRREPTGQTRRRKTSNAPNATPTRARVPGSGMAIEKDLAAIHSAQDLADALRISHTTLNKQFRAATGQSTWAYIKQHRLDHALRLIHETDLTLSDICSEIGIATIAQLSTDIRKMTGKSPRDLRSAT